MPEFYDFQAVRGQLVLATRHVDCEKQVSVSLVSKLGGAANPKSECRNPKQIRSPKEENQTGRARFVISFCLCNSDLFRISDFDIRIYLHRSRRSWFEGD
jgi:hypothetical protein